MLTNNKITITKLIEKAYFFLINFIPNKKLRHKLREEFKHRFYLDAIPIIAYKKKEVFLKNIEKYTTVAIGSSHCEFAFNPEFIDAPSFNFGINSFDNFMMYELYRNFIKTSSIKNIIAFYSVFSSGNNNIYRKDFKYSFLPLKYILNFNYEAEDKNLKKLCSKYTYSNNEFINDGFMPLGHSVYGNDTLSVKERCESHLKLHRKNSEDKWILKLANECIQDGKNFIFVIAPAQKTYKNNMPPASNLFNDIILKIKKITPYSGEKYNFYDTDIFENKNLWADPDHLNELGAEIFTNTLNKQLKEDNLI